MDAWEPLAPRWEKNHTVEVLQNYKNDCADFVINNEKYDSREFQEYAVKKIIDFVYDSNQFEDAGVSKIQTENIGKEILNKGTTSIKDPTFEEKETINHFLAVNFVIKNFPHKDLSISHLCQLHNELMKGVDESAGLLRQKIACAGMSTQYPDPESVPGFLEKVVSSFNSLDKDPHVSPFAKAAWLKCRFVEVHPFEDGNGRISRILMNWVLYKYEYKFPVAIASDGHRQAKKHYMQSLMKAVSGKNPGNISYLILRSVHNSITTFKNVLNDSNSNMASCNKTIDNDTKNNDLHGEVQYISQINAKAG